MFLPVGAGGVLRDPIWIAAKACHRSIQDGLSLRAQANRSYENVHGSRQEGSIVSFAALEAAGPAAIASASQWAATYKRGIEEIEKALRQRFKAGDADYLEINCPVEHRFCDGIYLRTITMPAGSIIVGAEHKTTHFNCCLEGRAEVMIDGIIEDIVAPQVFISKAGIRKVLFIFQTCVWSTIHANPDNCRDIEELERRFIVKTETV